MRAFFYRNAYHLTILTLSIVWFAGFYTWLRYITGSPFDVPISLSPPGKVEAHFKTVIPETYLLNFEFPRAGIPFEELRQNIGAMGVCPIGEACSTGVPIPIRWSVTAKGGTQPLMQGEVEAKNASAWSADDVSRSIGYIKVPPGPYVFRAQVLRPVPELSDYQARIVLSLRPRADGTWHLVFAWWVNMLQYFIVLPFALRSLAILLWLECLSTEGVPDQAP